MITIELLQELCPKTKSSTLELFVDPLNEVCEKYGIFENVKRTAGFLSQIIHESGGFIFTKENLNYSKDGLRKVFPKYFPNDVLAEEYARNPEKIANRVYSNRMDNGDVSSGDGWKFRGRGLIQLTGRFNYTQFANSMEIDLDEAVDFLETAEGAVESAGWFWNKYDLNEYCDNEDFVGLTKKINGGINGLADREHHYKLALEILEE